MTTGASALLACFLVLVLAGPAAAQDVRYAGKTTQGKRITIQTGAASGVAKRIEIDFVFDCNYTTITGSVVFTPPLTRASRGSFKSSGKEQVGKGSRTGKIRARIAGTRVDGNTLKGNFKAKGVYFKNGEKYATCRAVGVRWSASTGLIPGSRAHVSPRRADSRPGSCRRRC